MTAADTTTWNQLHNNITASSIEKSQRMKRMLIRSYSMGATPGIYGSNDLDNIMKNFLVSTANAMKSCRSPSILCRFNSVADYAVENRENELVDETSPADEEERQFLNEGSVDCDVIATLFSDCFDVFLRCLLLPALIIFVIVYAFLNLPVEPKAEIYRSLTVMFVILSGLTLQGCAVTLWAAHRYGFDDLLILLRGLVAAATTRYVDS